jgi:transposase
MRDTDLFQLALGLTSPWQVESSEFDPKQKRLDILIDFPRGGTFTCPECGGEKLKSYDTELKYWRHLNFFEHDAYLTARVPRVKCKQCGIHRVNVPWARKGSGFTLLFEAMVMTLAKNMAVKTIATFVGEQDTRLWRIIHHYVDKGRAEADFSKVKMVGLDETSCKRGHDYISLFVDTEVPRILFATEGKDASTVKRFKDDLVVHGGDPKNIEQMCSDMSPAFIKGVKKQFPDTKLTFDKFHIMKVVNNAVDEVRREEQKDRPELKRSRYVWLKNPQNLKQSQVDTLLSLVVKKMNLKTSRAYHIKLNFQELFNQPPAMAESFLKKWYFWATHSRLEPIKEAAYTIKRHWDGVLQWFKSDLTNGILEGLNSLLQAAKSRARGYRTTKNFIAIAYLIGGKFDLGLPT